jgi:ribonuclease Z
MRPSFHHRLVNSPFGDPALYLPFSFRRTAILFDAGDIGSLSNRDILKIKYVFVTHTHMDHFCGFDRILRLCLGRDKRIHLFGPAGFISNLEAKLNAYQWNLVDSFTYQLVIQATEVTSHSMITQTYRCKDGFIAAGDTSESRFSGILLETPAFNVQAVILDHQIPCLGLAVKERFHINISKPALTDLGLFPGPWLKTFKDYLFSDSPPETMVHVPATHARSSARQFPLEILMEEITRITTGQKVAYVTDAGFTPANKKRIIALADDSDHLYIEAAFLDKDRQMAALKYHLTARQAGHLAAAAHVNDFTIFHFSPRYMDQADDLYKEAHMAYEEAYEQ